MGKILRINLTNKKFKTQDLSLSLMKEYIGGKGFGTKILYDEVGKSVNPLSPENKLIFTVGPATGTLVPTSSKVGLFFKSPLTGIYAESYSSGQIAPRIKWAGYDVIVIEGKSKDPVYVLIDDGNIEIKNAEHLWGKDTYYTEDAIRKDFGDDDNLRVASIGKAGENLVKIACIENDYWRSFGRCGSGAVMGSKNLKAIAIRGTKKVSVAYPEKLESLIKEIFKKITESTLSFRLYGTPMMVDRTNQQGVFPTKYWQEGIFDEFESINAKSILESVFVRNESCFACPIACGKVCEVKEGPYSGVKVSGPEYETIFAFGGLCEISDIKAICKINDLCDRYGLDTISTGNVIAFAIEAYKRGKLKTEFPLDYGDPETIISLIELIAKREGIGNILAEGVKKASEKLSLKDLAIHVKGLELPGYDPRGLKAVSLAYAIATRGACHLRACAYAFELDGIFDRFSMDLKKVDILIDWEDRFTIFDSMLLCRFARNIYHWEDLSQIYESITGNEMSISKLREISKKITNLARMFSVREGISRKDDILPPKFFSEAFSKGSSAQQVISKAEFEKMLEEYYVKREWNLNGIPKKL
jgi:aldehyde:ferredoxin oxidoreductase